MNLKFKHEWAKTPFGECCKTTLANEISRSVNFEAVSAFGNVSEKQVRDDVQEQNEYQFQRALFAYPNDFWPVLTELRSSCMPMDHQRFEDAFAKLIKFIGRQQEDWTPPSRRQLAIAFAKWCAGYRQGDVYWMEEDEEAFKYVMRGDFMPIKPKGPTVDLRHPKTNLRI